MYFVLIVLITINCCRGYH